MTQHYSVKIIVILILFQVFSFSAHSGIDCRSMLGGYLKPISSDFGLSWATELTYAGGILDNDAIQNGLFIFGLQYDFSNNHSLYAEAGFKFWNNNKQIGNNPDISGQEFGPREFFYKYQGQNSSFNIGLHSTRLRDYFLLDDRALGVDYSIKTGNIGISAQIGSPMARFSRMAGDYCGMRRVYALAGGKKFETAGSRIGETSFFSTGISWTPSAQANKKEPATEDEFESVITEKNIFDEIGLIYYQEFGRGFREYKYYAGAFAGFNLPLDLKLQIETVHQQIPNEKALGIFTKLKKEFGWDSGDITSLSLNYIGKVEIDKGANFYPSFSNLYLGEVLRLDQLDMPVFSVMLKHDFAWNTKFSIKLRYTQQTGLSHAGEEDIEFMIKLFNHFKVSPIFSRIHSSLLPQPIGMVRCEIRAAY